MNRFAGIGFISAALLVLVACGGRQPGTFTASMANEMDGPVEQARVLHGEQVWQPGYVPPFADSGTYTFRLLPEEPLRVEFRTAEGRMTGRNFESHALVQHHGETQFIIQRGGTVSAVSRYDLRN